MYARGETDAGGAMEAALGGTPIINASNDDRKRSTRYLSLFSLDADTYQRSLNVPLKVSVKVDFVASRYVKAWEMPLEPGARSDHGRECDVIMDVLNKVNGVDIDLRETEFNFMFASSENRGINQDGTKEVYLLLNKKRGEAVKVTRSSGGYVGGLRTSSRMEISTMSLSFGPEENYPEEPDLNPEWLADATLVRLELTPVAEFSKEFSSDNFVIQAPHSR